MGEVSYERWSLIKVETEQIKKRKWGVHIHEMRKTENIERMFIKNVA